MTLGPDGKLYGSNKGLSSGHNRGRRNTLGRFKKLQATRSQCECKKLKKQKYNTIMGQNNKVIAIMTNV